MDAAIKSEFTGAKLLDGKVSSIRSLARTAGAEANDNAHAEYVGQFHGRRPSYLEACEADGMQDAVDAFDRWAYRAGVSEEEWEAVYAAFLEGWQSGADVR
jgi:hypothetical protein